MFIPIFSLHKDNLSVAVQSALSQNGETHFNGTNLNLTFFGCSVYSRLTFKSDFLEFINVGGS